MYKVVFTFAYSYVCSIHVTLTLCVYIVEQELYNNTDIVGGESSSEYGKLEINSPCHIPKDLSITFGTAANSPQLSLPTIVVLC